MSQAGLQWRASGLAARSVRNLPRRHWALLAFVLLATPVRAATLEGEVLYRERIMPPPGAVLSVTLEDTARADAPATELATVRTRLAGGPPYRWRLDYDDRLVDSTSRPVLRARIETPQGLWMTTDTVVTATTPAPVLQLRRVQTTADRCADAKEQPALNECAYQEFLEASAGMSRQLRDLESRLDPAQHSPWRRVQKTWLMFRTEACKFESSALIGGSARPMIQWQCTARMTRQRAVELERLAACREGDIACPAQRPGKAP